MTDSGDTKDDVKLPDNEEGKIIKERFENGDTLLVTVQVSCYHYPLSLYNTFPRDVLQLFSYF